MPIPHTHAPGDTLCELCGIEFPHMHPDKTKPREFTASYTNAEPENTPWWYSIANGADAYGVIERIVEEANRRRDEEWRGKLRGLFACGRALNSAKKGEECLVNITPNDETRGWNNALEEAKKLFTDKYENNPLTET